MWCFQWFAVIIYSFEFIPEVPAIEGCRVWQVGIMVIYQVARGRRIATTNRGSCRYRPTVVIEK